ncbi:response regulator [Streptomyces sp. NPDC101181]|uniref:response regulator n=1 Tax=Streptomyces sp. NPDC101181 TaxID=3366125 RepID=UPI0037FDE79C
MPREHRPTRSVRILLAESGAAARGALAIRLGMVPGFAVVARAATGDEAVAAATAVRPDVALVDFELPGAGGPATAAALLAEVPECRVLMLATFGGPQRLRQVLAAGAAGFLVEDGPVEDLVRAVRAALTGETVIDPAFTGRSGRTPDAPTPP